jgi:uncharacterized protein YjeT (DUF2065 family)
VAESMLFVVALFCSFCGMGWFALAKPAHWKQARGSLPLAPHTRRTLRALGAAALLVSMLLCFWVDHASMASLVWIMMLPASALLVTFALAWRPGWLTWLVGWANG